MTTKQAELVESCVGLAVHIAQRLARPGEDRTEAAGSALLALVRAALRFDPERGVKFSTFLFASIRNELSNSRIARRRHVAREVEAELDTFAVPPEAELRTLRREVRDAVETLPPRERATLHARYFDGSTLQEIATERGISRERVRQIESAVLDRLRRRLAPVGHRFGTAAGR